MDDSTPTQLRFSATAGFSVHADFEGGAVPSDFGVLLLQDADRQTGLIDCLASAILDGRHPAYIEHRLTDLLRQRIFQAACGYADGNDANFLRHDQAFKLATGPRRWISTTPWPLAPPSRAWRTDSPARTSTVWIKPSSMSSSPTTSLLLR